MKYYLTSISINYPSKTAKLRYYSKRNVAYPDSMSLDATCKLLEMYNIPYTRPDSYSKVLKKIFIAYSDQETFLKIFKLIAGVDGNDF